MHASPLDLDTEAELCGQALWGPAGVRVVGDHIRQLPPPPEVQIGDEVARQVLADAARAINAFAAVQVVPASVLDTDPAVLGMADPVVCEAIA